MDVYVGGQARPEGRQATGGPCRQAGGHRGVPRSRSYPTGPMAQQPAAPCPYPAQPLAHPPGIQFSSRSPNIMTALKPCCCRQEGRQAGKHSFSRDWPLGTETGRQAGRPAGTQAVHTLQQGIAGKASSARQGAWPGETADTEGKAGSASHITAGMGRHGHSRAQHGHTQAAAVGSIHTYVVALKTVHARPPKLHALRAGLCHEHGHKHRPGEEI